MRNRQAFFATPSDLEVALENLAGQDAPFSAYKSGEHESEGEAQRPRAVSELLAETDPPPRSAIASPSFLLLSADAPLSVRPFTTTQGRRRFFVDERSNPTSVSLRPPVLLNDLAILEGLVSYVKDHRAARPTYQCILKALKSELALAGQILIGAEAKALFKRGYRLTQNPRAPEKFDYHIP